jgi:protoporphyrinogen oxidase
VIIDMNKKVVILGAGLAGLSCANQLIKEGIDVTVLEKEKFAGGLAASHTRAGFFYDLGPHRFHSNKELVINFFKDLLKDNIISVERRSEIYFNDKFFIYPLVLSNITSCMPGSVLFKCSYDYIAAKIKNIFDPDPKCTFESWVERNYGRKMYEIFFRAYTEKILGIEPSNVSPDWAEQRISIPDLSTAIIKSFVKTKNNPRTFTSLFYYPREGGIGRVAELLKEGILRKGGKILLNVDVKRIKSSRFNGEKDVIQSVSYECGGQKYEEPLDYLMSTIPITDFLFLTKNKNIGLSICEEIKFRSIICLYLVLNYDHFTASHWIYLPERRFFSNRITEFKNFSDYSVPSDKTMICAEITCQYNDKKWNMSEEEIKDKVTNDIRKLGLKDVDNGAVAEYFYHKVNEAYPIYTLGYKDNIGVATRLLSSFHNLDCFGRNALFKYGNMDDSIEMGLNAADKYLRNSEMNVHSGDY